MLETNSEGRVKAKVEIDVKGKGNYTLLQGTTLEEFVDSLDNKPALPVVGAIINNQLVDLYHTLDNSCSIELVDISSEVGLRVYRRTVVFMLIKACRDLFPERKLIIKHTLSNGLYCEFLDLDSQEADLIRLEAYMHELVRRDLSIHKFVLPREEAWEIFRRQGQDDKVKLMEYRDRELVHVHELDGFYEYFYDYMLPSTGMVATFRLLHYPPGFIVQTPEVQNPLQLAEYQPRPKLGQMYHEARAWGQMLDTPHAAALNERIIHGDIADLIRVNEALHEKKIARIADQICENPAVRLILIAGPSSSGKTTFAQRLLIQLRVNGRRPVTLSLDNYFQDRACTPKDENGEYDFEALEALKLEQLNRDLQALIRGETVEVPVYNFKQGCCELRGVPTRVPQEEPIIIEGIHALNPVLTGSILEDQKYRIYISALTQLSIDFTNRIPTTDTRILRRIVRDHRTRGYSALDTIKRWPSVRRGEDRNIFPYQENADVMFNSSLLYELAVVRLFAEPLLSEIGPQEAEHVEATRLLKFLSYFRPVGLDHVPANSILREFLGGSCFDV